MNKELELDSTIIDWKPKKEDAITFTCNNYRVEKRQAEITYDEPLFIEQYHTLVFLIDGKEHRFERK